MCVKAQGKEFAISTALTSGPASAPSARTGSTPGPGTYYCIHCGTHLALRGDDRLSLCPGCGGVEFRLDSIFEPRQGHAETVTRPALAAAAARPGPGTRPQWLHEARRAIPAGSRNLAYGDHEGGIVDFPIAAGWTRIGRSVAAGIRLDDPSVSRRHAVIVSEPGHDLRVLDDRSLNGVLINDEPIEWGRLRDGDALTIGSYRLYLLEA